MAESERLDRASTALVVFDMQKGQFEVNDPERQRWLRESNVLGNTVELLQVARAAGLPVFYIQNTRRPDFADQKEVLTDTNLNPGKPLKKSLDGDLGRCCHAFQDGLLF